MTAPERTTRVRWVVAFAVVAVALLVVPWAQPDPDPAPTSADTADTASSAETDAPPIPDAVPLPRSNPLPDERQEELALAPAGELGSEAAGEHRLRDPRARWDSCAPIEVRVNAADVPPRAFADLEMALYKVSDASGLQLIPAGETDETVPDEDATGVLVTWAAGVGADPATAPRLDGRSWVSAHAAFDTDVDRELVQGFGPPGSRVAHYMRGLALAMGLEPVNDATQLLHTTFTASSAPDFGRGDLEGLGRLAAPCAGG